MAEIIGRKKEITEVAECFRGGSELRFLRLVGLAVFAIEVANKEGRRW